MGEQVYLSDKQLSIVHHLVENEIVSMEVEDDDGIEDEYVERLEELEEKLSK